MREYLKKLFKNNGTARGWMYVTIALAGVLSKDLYELATWLIENHAKLVDYKISWPVDGTIAMSKILGSAFAAVVVVGNTLRAYLDQHLSRNKVDEKTNADEPTSPTATTV